MAVLSLYTAQLDDKLYVACNTICTAMVHIQCSYNGNRVQ